MTNPVQPCDDRGNNLQPFQKSSGKTVSIAATTSSGSVAFDATGAGTVRVYNDGTTPAMVAFGAVATADDCIVPPGLSTLYLPDGVTEVAAIMATGSATLYFTPGKGA